MKKKKKIVFPLIIVATLAFVALVYMTITAVAKEISPIKVETVGFEEIPTAPAAAPTTAPAPALVYREVEKTTPDKILATSATEQENLEKLIDKIIELSIGEDLEDAP